MKYPKGSEWRKWDLHLHSPNTHLNNKYNCDYKTLADKIISEDIDVVGLTNYFILEENEIVELKKYLPTDKLIIPNFEFRINDKNKDGEFINIHVLFNPDTVSHKTILDSLSRVKLNNIAGDNPKYCTIENIKSLGADNVTIGLDELKTQLNTDFKKGVDYIIGGVAKGYGGFRPDNKPRNIQLAIKIDGLSDFIYGGIEDVNFFLNKEGERKNKLKNPKSVISCSDAHTISDIGKSFTWIKANPTFEGLKQILFEPETRVKIQSEKPDYKKDYLVIDKVRFITRDDKFQENPIEVNHNLNSIIGGKSSGKSLLLYFIAKTISPSLLDEIEKQYFNSNKTFGYSFEDLDFEVTWNDGFTQTLLNPQVSNRTITYVPQFYINEIAENTKDRKALNKLISDILKEDNNFYTLITEKSHQLQKLTEKQSLEISKYFNLIEKISEKNTEIKEIGDKDAILRNKDKLTKELAELRKESNFSEEDEKKYKDLFVEKEHYEYSINHFEYILSTLQDLKVQLGNYSKNNIENLLSSEFLNLLNENKEPEIDKLMSILKQNLFLTTSNTINSFLDFAFKSRYNHFINESNSFKEELKKVLGQLKPYDEKLANREKFEKIQKELNEENEKLRLIKSKEEENIILMSSLEEIKLLDTYQEIFENYVSRINITDDYKNIGEDLELKSYVSFNLLKFENNFISKVSKKQALQNQFSEEIFEGNNFLFTPDKHISNIKSIIDKVFEGKIQLNQGATIRDLVNGLLSDCFEVEFDLVQKGDRLLKMSPGKRGLVLFQLFLKLSNSTNPILIDQPEDNLDNRTVYTQLNDFIKNRKIHRQILMVSHNANLVVSTDSENVIVANQHGQNIESQKRKYDFEYVSGALENSFKDDKEIGILFQKGIREHVCEILEGGEEAFQNREKKYGLYQQ